MNVKWSQKMTNKALYNGIPKLSDTIRYRRLQFAGHAWRHNEEIVHDLIFWQPTHGKNKKGRPYKTYIDQIKDDTNLPVNEIKSYMENRPRWKEFIKSFRRNSIQ